MLLKRGSTGNAVALVQYALNGVTTFPPKLRAFAPKTEEHVRQHQSKLRLRPDGIVGPLTLDSLFKIATLKGKVKFKPNGGVYRTDSTGSQSKLRQPTCFLADAARPRAGRVHAPPAGEAVWALSLDWAVLKGRLAETSVGPSLVVDVLRPGALHATRRDHTKERKMAELEYRSRRQYQPDHVTFDDTRRGRAPTPPPIPPNPLREAIVKTPTTAKEVYQALTRAWTVANMGAPATPTAVKILLAQSALETASWTACQNWNLGGIKAGHPEKERHILMETMEDWPARKAEGAVAFQKKIRPDNPEVIFKADKNLAIPGKLRVWILAYFRTWPDLHAGARGFSGTIGGGYRAALQFAYAGQPEQYASAISEDVRGEGKGYFSGPSVAYGRLMRGHFNRFMSANLD